MEPEPWEVLDLEVEDSLLLPCKRKNPISPTNPFLLGPCVLKSHSQFHSIPGPAGAVRSAMHRKILLGVGDDPMPTQEYIRRAVEDPGHSDDDFSRHPWLFAVDFVRHHGLLGSDGVAIGTPLSYIKTGINMDKVSQIVAIIKSCTPNGLGDMMVTLKDPTGTIDASIHRRVLTENEFGKDITVGAVLILQKVAVFCPSHSARYLNITLSNIVKVFSITKDSGIPSKHNYPALAVKDAATTVESSEQSWMPPKTSSPSQGRTEGILNCLRQSANVRGSTQNEKEMEKVNSTVSSKFRGGRDSRNKNSDGEKESLSVSLDIVDGRKETAVNTGTTINEQSSILNQSRIRKQLGDARFSSAADIPNNEEDNGSTKGVMKHRELLISRGSLPEWTDEQLDELLSFD